jgi:sugar lactone lactonase YvrE
MKMRMIIRTALITCALASLFCNPSFGLNGELYVGDSNGLDVLNSAGAVTARFTSDRPSALLYDGKGGIYAAFWVPTDAPDDAQVLRFTNDGKSSFVANGFLGPSALAMDSQGNLYVTDEVGGTVEKVAPNLVKSRFATLKQGANPTALACDNKDNIYVAIGENPFITVISPLGAVSTFGSALTNVLHHTVQNSLVIYDSPVGMAFDGQQNLYISFVGPSGDSIQKVGPDGTVSTVATGLSNLSRLAFDFSGNLYAGVNGEIDQITPEGTVTTFSRQVGNPASIVVGFPTNPRFTTPNPASGPDITVVTLAGFGQPGDSAGTGTLAQFNGPNGGFVDAQGNVWIADQNNHRIKRMTPVGQVSIVAGSGVAGFADGPAATAQFRTPAGVCVDSSGNAYVADSGNNRIRRITADGQVSTVAGTGTPGYSDGAGTRVQFNAPDDLVVDKAGDLFVTDSQNHAVRKITPTGVVTTVAGNGTAGAADGAGTNAFFNQPMGIAIDPAGNLFVTEWSGQRVRKVDTNGVVTTVAGDGTAGLHDDWGTAAKFDNPDGIVVGTDGNIYVADNGNNAIRRLDTDGYVFTIAGMYASGFVDGNGQAAQFLNPTGIGWGKDGTLFVIDGGNNAVRQIVWGLIKPTGMVVRHLPALYAPGGQLQVVLEVHPPPAVTSYTVADTVPPGWTFASVSDNGVWDNAGGNVTFGPILNNRVRMLSYTLQVPAGESGSKQFSGTFSPDGTGVAILGDSQIFPVFNADLLGPLNAILTTGGRLQLTNDGIISLTNTFEVTQDVVLDGAGHNVTLSGNKQIRLFNVHPNVSLTLLNMTLADGLAQGESRANHSDPALIAYGGCIANQQGAVLLSNCVLNANFANGGDIQPFPTPAAYEQGGSAFGGAIYSQSGQITLLQTVIQQGGATGGKGYNVPSPPGSYGGPGGDAFGGAVYALNAKVTISSSTISSNSAIGGPAVEDVFFQGSPAGAAFGGALYASNCVVGISNSTFSASTAVASGSHWAAGKGGGGGALYLTASTGDIHDSVFSINQGSGNGNSNGSFTAGGGAIFNDQSLSVDRCQFSSNSIIGSDVYGRGSTANPGIGGAIFNSGQASVRDSVFVSNVAEGGNGSDFYMDPGIAGSAYGGAVFNEGQLTLVNNTFANNSAIGTLPASTPGMGFGGALFDIGTTFATNDTFYGNLAAKSVASNLSGMGFGGAIGASDATMVLVNTTLAGNTVNTNGFAGGIWQTNSTVTVQNSILANLSGNCVGSLIDGGNNISSDASCQFTSAASVNNTDPLLGPFGDYGGPTFTIPLLAGSPAIDHGNDAVAPATDQRGHARPYGKASDIGAFESSPPYTILGQLSSFWHLTNVSVSVGGASSNSAGTGPFTIHGLAAGNYMVTPTLTNYLFVPATQSVTLGPDVIGLQFKGYQLNALSPEPPTNGSARFVLAGQAGDTWQIQRSTNLSSWQTIGPVTIPTNGVLEFIDPLQPGDGGTFYRGRKQ